VLPVEFRSITDSPSPILPMLVPPSTPPPTNGPIKLVYYAMLITHKGVSLPSAYSDGSGWVHTAQTVAHYYHWIIDVLAILLSIRNIRWPNCITSGIAGLCYGSYGIYRSYGRRNVTKIQCLNLPVSPAVRRKSLNIQKHSRHYNYSRIFIVHFSVSDRFNCGHHSAASSSVVLYKFTLAKY